MARETKMTPAHKAQPLLPAAESGEPSGFTFSDGAALETDIHRIGQELGENSTEAKVQIWRIRKGERRAAFVATIAPQNFSMERVAEDFGGGVYNIKVFVPKFDEDGTRKGVMLAHNPIIEIDGLPKEPKRPDPIVPGVPAVPQQSDIAQLAAVMIQSFQKLGETIAGANANRPSQIDMLKELMALKALFSNDAPKAVSDFALFEKFLTMQETMRSALDRLPGKASDNQIMLALGRDFLNMFKSATRQPAAAGDAPALPVPAPEPEPLAPIAPADASPPPADGEPMELIFRGYVKLLVENAKANNDVGELAQTIYDQAPEDFLAELFQDDKYLDRLAKYNPNVKLYPAWFDRLRARIKEIYDADQSGNG